MRVRTLFYLSMLFFAFALAAIAVTFASTNREAARLDAQTAIATRIDRNAAVLDYLAADYLMYRERQQYERWEDAWAAASEGASELRPVTRGERESRDSITASLARLKVVFDETAASAAISANKRAGASTLDTAMNWSRLAVQRQATAFEVQKLLTLLDSHKQAEARRNGALIFWTLVLFGCFLVANYWIVYRRVLRGLADLREGTRVVGSGNLDFAIPVGRNDELRQLTRAFNRMAVDLQLVTASRTLLESEVAERERAQVALSASLRRVEELSDSREAELSTTRALLDAARSLAEWTDLDKLLNGLADVVLASARHARVTIQLWDEGRRELQTVVVRGDSHGLAVGTVFRWEDLSSVGQEVIRDMGSSVIDFDALPPDLRGGASGPDTRLGLVVSLAYQQQLLGLVRVDTPGERLEFDADEIALIEGIAAQASVAVENARHYEEERLVADALREVFQPPVPALPGIALGVAAGYASQAARVGGDFYDVFAVDHSVMVLVGDVAGHGLQAARLTERVRSTIRALSYAEPQIPLAELLEKTSASLGLQFDTCEFVTAVLLAVDAATGECRVARAGHPLPIICGETRGRFVDASGGPPLGVTPAKYEEARHLLKQGETIILYTDGVIEARSDGEFYGEHRLLEMLSCASLGPGEVAAAVFEDVQRFAGGALADDVLVVAVQLVDSVSP